MKSRRNNSRLASMVFGMNQPGESPRTLCALVPNQEIGNERVYPIPDLRTLAKWIPNPISAALLLVVMAGLCRGEEPLADRLTRVQKQEARQQQIQGDSQRLVAVWTELLDEPERNALKGGETEAAKNLHGVVSRLSQTEMGAVIELLEKSRGALDPNLAQQQIVGAHSKQKGILVELKRLLAEFDRNRVKTAIVSKLGELNQRAEANLQKTVELQRLSKSAEKALFAPVLKASLEEQQREQLAIDEDLKAAISDIENLKPENRSLAEPWKAVLAKAKEASPVLSAAAEALKQAQLPQAIEQERAARDAMRQIARLLTPEDSLKLLREGEQKLDQMIKEQQAVIKQTASIPEERTIDQWIAKAMQDPASPLAKMLAKTPPKAGVAVRDDPRVQDGFEKFAKKRNDDAAALEKREAGLGENARDLRSDLENSGKKAAEEIKGVEGSLQSAGRELVPKSGLGNPDVTAAVKGESAALRKMQAAMGALQQELAQAEAAASSTSSSDGESAPNQQEQTPATAQAPPVSAAPLQTAATMETLKDLQKQTHDLATQEAQAATEAKAQAATEKKAAAKPGAPVDPRKRDEQNLAAVQAQKAMLDRAGQLQQRIAAVAPQAAQSLLQAAGEMQRAQAALTDPAQRGAAALAAQKSLDTAEKQLGAEISKSQQANDALAAAHKAADLLPALIAAEQNLELETLKAAAPGAPPTASKDIAEKQKEIHKDLMTLRRTPGVAPDATRALNDAEREMGAAKSRAMQKDVAGADKSERAAVDKLDQARKAQAEKIAALEKQLGRAPAPQAADAGLARYQLERAQAQIQQAMSAMAAEAGGRRGDAETRRRGEEEGGGMQEAARQLKSAEADVAQAQGSIPSSHSAAAAIEKARGALAAGVDQAEQAGQKSGGNASAALENAASAQKSLAQASALLAQEQAGITPANENQNGQASQSQPADNQPAQSSDGKAQSSEANGKPGESPEKQASQPGGTDPHGNNEKAEQELKRGANEPAKTKSQFIGLPPRDRAVIEQTQSENYPAEYGAMVEQYMQNLSDRPHQ